MSILNPYAGGGSSSGSSGEIYSTEETRIGTWIDGKPIYRKVFGFSQVNNGAVNIVFNLSDIDASLSNVINLFGAGELQSLATSTGSSCAYGAVFIEPSSNNVCIKTNYAISGPVYIVIEYAKTTDTAN